MLRHPYSSYYECRCYNKHTLKIILKDHEINLRYITTSKYSLMTRVKNTFPNLKKKLFIDCFKIKMTKSNTISTGSKQNIGLSLKIEN